MTRATSTIIVFSLSLAACNSGDTGATSSTGPAPSEPTKIEPTQVEPIKVEPTPIEPAIKHPTKQCRPPANVSDACPLDRRVGRFNGDCPPAYAGDPPKDGPRWSVEPMFALGGNRYCRYVWSGDPSAPAPLPKDLAAQLGPDCRVFAQSPMAGALAGAYERSFAEGTRPLASAPPDGHPVAIAVVDTAPAQTQQGQSPHGRAVSAIIAKLAGGCVPGLGDDECQRTIVSELGLPQTRTGPNADLGGFFGYQSELAEGIMRALDRVPLDDRKLVLNLAVGWEPVPGELTSPTPAVSAVRDAIAVAHCRGAAIVAASGNRPPGNTCVTQATAPGAWASEPGWTAAQCSALGLVGNQVNLPSPLHGYHPFLHAATPVGWDAGNLADFREGSNARFAVTGFAGTASRGGQSYGPMTGSSVATAALSGIAALVWSYFPDMSADAVMQVIYDSGTSTSRNASLVLPQSSLGGLAQQQVTACGALLHACSQSATPPSICSTLAGLCPSNVAGVDASAWSTDFDNALAQLTDSQQSRVDAPTWTTIECVGCNQKPRFVMLPPGLTREPAALAWVVPQPQLPPCPVCKIKKPSTQLYLSLDPSYDGFTLLDMSITLTDPNGATEVLYYPPAMLSQVNSTTVQVITDPELATVGSGAAALSPVRAYVHMTFDDAGTVTTAGNEVPIY